MRNRPRVKPFVPNQMRLMPPSPLDWLPKTHFAYFIFELLTLLQEQGELKAFYAKFNKRSNSGHPSFNPTMILGILIYAYSIGMRSSRKIAQALYQDVALRYLCAENFPSYRTIARFRQDHAKDFHSLFVSIIQYAQNSGRSEFKEIGIDGTKIKANASKLKNRNKVEDEELKALEEFVSGAINEAINTDDLENSQASKDDLEEMTPEMEEEFIRKQRARIAEDIAQKALLKEEKRKEQLKEEEEKRKKLEVEKQQSEREARELKQQEEILKIKKKQALEKQKRELLADAEKAKEAESEDASASSDEVSEKAVSKESSQPSKRRRKKRRSQRSILPILTARL